MAQYFKIQASPKIIQQATALFNATITDIIIELLQNSRRGEAQTVTISPITKNNQPWLVIEDNGIGIFRDGVDITLGKSHWAETIQNREYPAGMGIFSLAQRECTIEANNHYIHLQPKHFIGEELVKILHTTYTGGTRISFQLHQHEISNLKSQLASCCEYYPLPVIWQDKQKQEQLPQQDFLEGAVYSEEWEGLQIALISYGYSSVNFYGLIIPLPLPSLSDCLINSDYEVLRIYINVVDAPKLRLTLPSRKEIVENEFYDQLESYCTGFLYRYLATLPQHYLSFAHYQNALQNKVVLSPAYPQLYQYYPSVLDEEYTEPYYSKFIALDTVENPLVIAFEETAAFEQVFYRCFAKAHPDATLLAENKDMVGYQWYDNLPKITALSIQINYLEGTYPIQSVPSEKLTENPQSIDITITITSPEGIEKRTFAADIAMWQEEPWNEDLYCIDFFIPPTSNITVNELMELMLHSFFRYYDESGNDTYETQKNVFQEEAEYKAISLLNNPKDSLKQYMESYFYRHFRWILVRDEKMVISIANGDINIQID